MTEEKIKIKRIFKYATGESPPEGATYLATVTQTKMEVVNDGIIPCYCHDDPLCSNAPRSGYIDCWFVWHYFLVETK